MITEDLRVWDKKTKQFVVITALKLNEEDPNMGTVTLESGEIKEFPKEVDVMAYASLKDKNEKKIFEKDILKFTLEDITSYAIVLRMYNFFTLKSIMNNTTIPLGLVKDTIEYAGNVWQNPEIFERELLTINKVREYADNKNVVINDIEIPVSTNHFALSMLTTGFEYFGTYFEEASKQKKDILTPLGYLSAILEQVQSDPIERETILGKYETVMGKEKIKVLMDNMWAVYNAS